MSLLSLAPISSIIALLFSGFLVHKILKENEGTEKMTHIAEAIRIGAKTYLKRQYVVVAVFFTIMFIILFIMATAGLLTYFVPFGFLTGGFFSALSGYIGMMIATKANVRTTNAVKKSLNQGLRIAFSGGAVMGLVVVGLALFNLSIWFYFLKWFYRTLPEAEQIVKITSAMLYFGMGASAMALFARVGGGIFTKAADVGADLVGKVEVGIPEDDPRNPAVIADNVGDNVGDVAGMGADLYESYVGSIVATAALAAAAGLGFSGVAVPLIIAAVGILASIIGTFFVKAGKNAAQSDLLKALRRGIYITAGLITILSYFLVKYLLGVEHIGVFYALITGLAAGLLIGFFTEYFTSETYLPTRKLSESSEGGPATVIISGLALGMSSTVLPVLIIGSAVLLSYYFSGGFANFNLGLYGIGVSAVGLLSTLGITLASDAYGPIADNAGGIAEMSEQDPVVRERTDALDSLGNTTAATGKGFAIGSAALTALALIAAYKSQVELIASEVQSGFQFELTILNPPVLIGLLIGAMLPFVFAALTMNGVGRAAHEIVREVRKQFKENSGIMEGTAEPDYKECVYISTSGAQREMILPALIAVTAPVIVGLLLGANGVAGMLAGATMTGFVLAVMMSNAGGSWDNAKKYIESGHHGGKGSDAHKASVVGDTVGDPFKDTSGPSINILIKLLSMVSIVFAAFVLQNSLL